MSKIIWLKAKSCFHISEILQQNSPNTYMKIYSISRCQHKEAPNNFGLGHGCELAITILCDLHCTNENLKVQGYTSGLCKPFDPNCYCRCQQNNNTIYAVDFQILVNFIFPKKSLQNQFKFKFLIFIYDFALLKTKFFICLV